MPHLCECGCGKPTTPGHRFVNGHCNKGRKRSSEQCLHISIAKKGKKLGKMNRNICGPRNPNFGHHKLKGTKIPEERRLRIIQSLRALPKEVLARRSMLGVRGVSDRKSASPDFEEKRREKIKKGVIRRYVESPQIKEILRAKRLQQKFPVKDTFIERKLRKLLVDKGILFVMHKSVLGLTQPDFFVAPNICIFVDGCYWHGCMSCYSEAKLNAMQRKRIVVDSVITQKLQSSGYVVLRFWEHDIKHNPGECLTQIMALAPKQFVGLFTN